MNVCGLSHPVCGALLLPSELTKSGASFQRAWGLSVWCDPRARPVCACCQGPPTCPTSLPLLEAAVLLPHEFCIQLLYQRL